MGPIWISGTRRSIVGAMALVAMTCLSGCVESIPFTDLPALKSERPLLTAEQQEKAMADLQAKKDAEAAEALRQIEQQKKK
jgi:hypothetical protein